MPDIILTVTTEMNNCSRLVALF